jgi:hypothetical protein
MPPEDDEPSWVMGTVAQNRTALHIKFSVETDKAWRTNTSGLGGRGRLLPWDRYTVWDNWIECSGSCAALKIHDCSHTITDNIWRSDEDIWNHSKSTTKTATVVSIVKRSNQAAIRETSGTHSHRISRARRSTRLDTSGEGAACWTSKLYPCI